MRVDGSFTKMNSQVFVWHILDYSYFWAAFWQEKWRLVLEIYISPLLEIWIWPN